MELQEKADILAAALAGKTIQHRNRGTLTSDEVIATGDWLNRPGWADIAFVHSNTFNFSVYDYRVKPEPREFWVNAYPSGWMAVHSSPLRALDARADGGKTIRVREVLED